MSKGQQWAMHEWPITGLQMAHAVQHGPFCGGHRHGLSQGPTMETPLGAALKGSCESMGIINSPSLAPLPSPLPQLSKHVRHAC